MPKSSTPLHLAAAAMLACLAVPLVTMGVVGLAHLDELWWLYGLLLASGGLMGAGGVATAVRWHRALGEEERTQRAMLEAAQLRLHAPVEPAALSGKTARAGSTSSERETVDSTGVAVGAPAAMPVVLAHWTYPPEEWSAYTAREVRYRVREAVGMGAGTVALGTLALGVLEGKWGLAFAVSAVIGAVIGVGRGIMAAAVHRSNASARYGEAIIGPTAILLNGRYQVLDDGRIRFGGARLLEDERPPVLEITVMVPGKYRPTAEEYRIPIPAGREEEARALVAAFRHAYPDAPAR